MRIVVGATFRIDPNNSKIGWTDSGRENFFKLAENYEPRWDADKNLPTTGFDPPGQSEPS